MCIHIYKHIIHVCICIHTPASHDGDTGQMPLHDQKIAPHFDYLYLRNVLVPLTMFLVSCDTCTGTNGIT